jgi:hypothetical protein
VFHAGGLPPSLPAALAEADDFVRALTPRLAPRPQPHRNHPYWRGAMAAFARRNRAAGIALPIGGRVAYLIYTRLFGRSPEVRRAHPRWQDFTATLAACKPLTGSSTRLLIGASRATPVTEWLRRHAPDAAFIALRRTLRHRELPGLDPGSFDAAFIELLDNDVAEMDMIVRAVAALMRPGAEIVIASINGNWHGDPENFGRQFAQNIGPLVRFGLWPVESHIASTSRLRWRINRMTVTAARAAVERPTALLPLHFLAAVALCPLMAGANLIGSRCRPRPPQGRIASSIFVRLRLGAGPERSKP